MLNICNNSHTAKKDHRVVYSPKLLEVFDGARKHAQRVVREVFEDNRPYSHGEVVEYVDEE